MCNNIYFILYTVSNQNSQNLLSGQRKYDSDKKSEDKKENAAFEHSRDQRIQSAKRSSEKQIDSTKTEKNLNKILQLTGNQVFFISCQHYISTLYSDVFNLSTSLICPGRFKVDVIHRILYSF